MYQFDETPFDYVTTGNVTSFKQNKPEPDEWEIVTPEIAAKWLAKNAKNNRKINEHIVGKYARMMANGDWDARGHDPIGFCEDGFLQNGQHRLSAVIQSETSIPFPIARNLSKNAIEKLDQGKTRSVSNVAQIRGIDAFKQQYYTILVRMFELSGVANVSRGGDKHLLLDFVEAYWDLIVDVHRSKIRSEVSAVCANAILLGYDKERVLKFLEILSMDVAVNITERESGALVLRRYLDRLESKKRADIMNNTQSALRAFLQGKEIKQLMPTKKLFFGVPELKRQYEEKTVGDPI